VTICSNGLDEYEERDGDFLDLVTLLHEWAEAAPEDVKTGASSRELNAFEASSLRTRDSDFRN
jgi:hypothetical protein